MSLPTEVKSFFKSFPLFKVVGFDAKNNLILRELAHELSFPLCSLLNQYSILSWLSFVNSLPLSYWYPGSGVVLDCIDS